MNTPETMKRHKKPLNRSITLGCVIFIIALCVILSFVNLTLYKNYVYDSYRNYIAELIDYNLAHIDGDNLKACIDSGEESDKYKETLLFMDNVIDHFDDIHYLYAVRPLNTEKTGNMMSVLSAERYHDRYVDTEGNLYLGWISDDEFDQEIAAQFFDIMNGDDIVYFEEKTEWGTDYTGAVAIKDSNGEGVAVLAVDIDISFLQGRILRYALINIGIIMLLGAVFLGLFLLWSRRNITRPIKALEQSAVGFADHSHGQRSVEALHFNAPEMKTENEVKALSDAVVKMTNDMRDYVSDIISAEAKAASMQELANRDALTGIRNKTAYDNEIKRIDEQIRNGETKIGLAVADLNYLKKINDTYGHDKGNIAIQKLCQIVSSTFAHSAVFRIGGDEFVIVLQGNDYVNYDHLAKELQMKMDEMVSDETLQPWEKVSAAIGAAFFDETIDGSMEGLFRRADKTMYEQKRELKQRKTRDPE